MKKTMMDNLQRLIDAHPGLFRGAKPPGVSWVPTGWFDLVDRLCYDIEHVLGADITKMKIDQLKEEFAQMRLSYTLDVAEPEGEALPLLIQDHDGGVHSSRRSRHPLRRAVDERIAAATEESIQTCQWCSSKDEVRIVVGGQTANPAKVDRNNIGPGLLHACCIACRGDAPTTEEWQERVEQRRAEIKRKMDQGET